MAWIVPALAIALGAPLVPAMAQEGTPAEAARGAATGPGSKGHGKMVFGLTTGLEVLKAVSMSINHARIAHQSGYLDEAVLLVHVRSVQAFARDITAKPPQLAEAMSEAERAGVRIVACGEALKRIGTPEDRLELGVAEVVPNAIHMLAELASRCDHVIKY